LRSELSRRCALLALTTGITASVVTTLAVTTFTTSTSTTTTKWLALALALSTHHTTRRSMGSLLLDVGSWDNLSGKVKPLAEVIESLWGEGVIVVLPGELSLDITTGGK
jgi:hypothetical protein